MQNYARGACELSMIQELLASPEIRRAFLFIERTDNESTEELIRLCEIPAPPFKEEARGRHIKRRFEEIGLGRVRTDEAGNVIAERPGRSTGPSVIVSAHLDTIFPEGTD